VRLAAGGSSLTGLRASMPFDIENSQALWRELPNLVMGTEADLILAATYKALQPPEVPPFE
jgi:hypothetical protein